MRSKIINSNNEVNLIELLKSLWNQKWYIFIITILFVSSAVIYIKQSTPVYQVTTTIYTPKISEINEFNYFRSVKKSELLPSIPSTDIYSAFEDSLISTLNKRKFFDQFILPKDHGKVFSSIELYNQFSKDFIIKKNDLSSGPSYTVSFKNSDPEKASKWLKLYIEKSNQIAVHELSQMIKKQNQFALNYLVTRINIIQNLINERRKDRINILKEALSISEEDGHKSSLSNINLDENTKKLSLMSTNAIKEEIRALNRLRPESLFIPELFDLKAEYKLQENNIEIEKERISSLHWEEESVFSSSLIFPRKKIILILAVILGCIVATGFAFIKIILNERGKFT